MPRSAASWVQAVLMIPVPPMKRTRMLGLYHVWNRRSRNTAQLVANRVRRSEEPDPMNTSTLMQLALGLSLGIQAFAQQVHSDFDPGAAFGCYRTFA